LLNLLNILNPFNLFLTTHNSSSPMPVFEYIALDHKGRERKGIVNAESSRLALQQLRTQRLFPRNIAQVQSEQPAVASKRRFRISLSRIKQGDLVIGLRQLATLLSAGLPLASCLDSVLQQMKRGKLYRVFAQVRERVHEGSSLAAAMEEHSHVFPPAFSAMVRAGESSGTLELVLDRLAEFGEQQQALRRQIQSSLAYPILILIVSLAVIFFLMTYVVPKVTQIFLDFDQALPLPTIILMALSNALHAAWWVIPIAFALLFFTFKKAYATPWGKKQFDRLLLKLPFIGPIAHHIVLSRFCHTLGTLLKNDVSLLQSLRIVRNVVSNSLLHEAVDGLIKDVSEGSSMAHPLSKSEIFPSTMVQLIAAGEQSSQLDAMFLKVADSSENYVTSKLAMLTSLLEPIMILVLGGIVGFVVLAVLLPIFDMSQLVQ